MIGTFKTSGDLDKALMEWAKPVQRAVKLQVLREAGEPIRSRMAALAPRSDEAPHIYQNVVMSPARSVDGVRLREDEAALAIGPDGRVAAHGILQEFGTAHHGPQPFARPAWDSESPRALRILGDVLWNAVKKRNGTARSTSGRGL